jgi:Zinc carboxypeptidase.
VLDRDLAHELDTVPDFDRFAGVDEVVGELARLAAEYPAVAELRRIGTSRLGEPLHCLTVGDGPNHGIVVAMPHPNEPIGALTAMHLARRMCEDAALRRSSGYTWHIVGCIDPDGTRLNEAWFTGRFTPCRYGRHFYRPAGDEQTEWTFPFAYKDAYFDRVMPETLAWMRLIDEVRPAFMSSLHNSERGGVFFYVNRPESALHPLLKALPARYGLPLHLGEPEHPSVERLDDAIYLALNARAHYDYLERTGQKFEGQIAGASSAEYAARHGTFVIIVELPYWRDDAAGDHSPAGVPYATVLRDHAAELAELVRVLRGTLDAVLGEVVSDSPFLRASRFFVPLLADVVEMEEMRAAEPGNEREATVAEVKSAQDLVHTYRLRYTGMLLRALEAEIGIGNGTPEIRARHRVLEEVYAKWTAAFAADTAADPIPLRDLVAIQYGTILAGARHAKT